MIRFDQNNCDNKAECPAGKLPVVITNCTNRKRIQPAAESRLSADSQRDPRTWAARVMTIRPMLPAQEMYCGRSFKEAAHAAAFLSADFWIASAGLGFVNARTPIPAYGATAAPGHPDSIAGDTEAWFARLIAAGPFPGVPDISAAPLVLAALSSAYLSMLKPWLMELTQSRPGCLRLFTLAEQSTLPGGLRESAMPYDRRLEDPTLGRAGTVGDFAQRAMRDFVESVLPAIPNGSAADHAEAVQARLERRVTPPRPSRRSASDDELRALIRAHWDAVGGRSGRMLRLLRDELEVACEQSRFKDIFNGVAAQEGDIA